MAHHYPDTANPVLIRGACLWMLMAHLDFLIMTSLILGFHASRVSLPWHVRWAMVVGAFTNSSLFMLFAIFPRLDPVSEQFIPNGPGATLFNIYMYSSLIMTSYGFGKGAVLVLKSTFNKAV